MNELTLSMITKFFALEDAEYDAADYWFNMTTPTDRAYCRQWCINQGYPQAKVSTDGLFLGDKIT